MTAGAYVQHDTDGTWLVIRNEAREPVFRYDLADLFAAAADPDADAYRVARGSLLRGLRAEHGDTAARAADVALAAFERERGTT